MMFINGLSLRPRPQDGIQALVTTEEAYRGYIRCILSEGTHPEIDNTDQCEACIKQGDIFLHTTNFEHPCKCCGSQDHGLLTCTHETDDGNIRNVARVICPSVWTTCIYNILQEDRMSMKNRPSAHKFAEAHSYNITKAKSALKQCFTSGSGWYMYPQQFDVLVSEVTQICYEVKNPKFTRDTSYLQDIDDDDSYEDDELPLDMSGS